MAHKPPYEYSKDWVSKRFISFTIEDLKQAFKMSGGKITGNGSEWGGVLRMLENNDFIFKHPVNEFTTVRRPNGKKRTVNVWISKEMRLKQQRNATKDKDTLTINFE